MTDNIITDDQQLFAVGIENMAAADSRIPDQQDRSCDSGGERILYVCYDATKLISRERFLMGMGYEVCSILGEDGLIARSDVDSFDFVLIGDEGSPSEQRNAIDLLKEIYPRTLVIALCHQSITSSGILEVTLNRPFSA